MANGDEPPTASTRADPHPTRTVEPAAGGPAPDRRIGPYRLLRELGHGGMGTVYLAARADEQFQKRVALKVIRGADSAEVVRHFKRERQILASLEHPNIARLLDGGSTDDGLPYFVMEHIEGQPLLEYCDSRSLSIADRLKLFQSICSAVQYAHRNLVVHRDIKPGNILVAQDGTPRLLDFGIAKLLNPGLSGDAATATSMLMTPAYASPEQVRGELITTASDVYSLGVVLYELLTGHHPYRLVSRHPLEVLKAISEQEPEKPSTAVERREPSTATQGVQGSATAEPTETMTASAVATPALTPEAIASTREGTPDRLKRRLRGDLDNILMLALNKEPQRRYASVEAFSDDVRRYLDGQPVRARKPTVAYRTGKFVRRHLVGVAASFAVLALLVGFALAMAAQSERVTRERDLARRERETAQRVSAFLVDLFKVSDPSEARGNTITAREVLDKGAAKIATELKDQPQVRATLMDTMGNVYRNLGLLDAAIPLLQQALDGRKTVLGSEHADVALSLSDLANLLWDKGDYAASERLHREALAMRRRLFGNEHADVAKSLNNLAIVVYEKGDIAEAEALYREALAMRRRLYGNEHADVATSLNNLGDILHAKGDHAGAAGSYREALAMRRRLLGNEHPKVAASLNNLAGELSDQGAYAESEALHREALAMERKLLGDEHPQVAMSLDNLAHVLALKGDRAEAETLQREALALRRKQLGNDHPHVAISLAGLAETLCGERRPAEGVPPAREAVAIFGKALPAGHPHVAEAESILGGCLTLSKQYPEAEALLLGSHAVLEAKLGGQSPEAHDARQRLLDLYEAWGKPDKAANYRALLAAGGPDAKK